MLDTLHRRCSRGPRLLAACLAALVPMAVGLGGCSLIAPAPGPPPRAAVTPDFSRFQQMTNALIERARRLDAMQAEAVMDYEGGGQRVKVREEVAVKRPASLRVEALTPFGVAAVVAVNGATVGIYQPSENTFYRGAANADTLSRFTRIPLAPEAAVKLLMGLLPDDEANFAAPKSVRTEGDLLVGTYELAGGTVDELGFANGQLRLVRAGRKSGPSYEVNYSDYRDIGGLVFAHRLDANFLNTATRLSVRYSGVIVNPTLSDSQFVLVPQAAARQIDLDHPATTTVGGHG